MKKSTKKILEPLLSILHWIGWLISSTVIFVVFWVLMSGYNISKVLSFIILLALIVIIDYIKHKLKLQ